MMQTIWTHQERVVNRGVKNIKRDVVNPRALTPEQEANRERLKQKLKNKKIDPKQQALLKLIEAL